MTDETKSGDWQVVWDARLKGLEAVLGPSDPSVYHAVVPFHLGGSADAVSFSRYVSGKIYVTVELTGEDNGQLPGPLGNYELCICVKGDLKRAADLISQLARYTCDAVLGPGETMDLGEYLEDRTIRGLIFSELDPVSHFEILGRRCGLLTCIGITKEELAFKQSHSGAELLDLLKEHGVFPYTIPNRDSVPLPGARKGLLGWLRGIAK